MSSEFENAVDGVIDLFGGAYGHKFEVGPATLNAWRMTLADCTPREIELAAVAWVQEAPKWPPSAPEFLDRIRRERATNAHRRKLYRATLLEALNVDLAMHQIEESDANREAFIKREGRGAYLWWSERRRWAQGVLARAEPRALAWAHEEHAHQLEYRTPVAGRHGIPRLASAAESLSVPVSPKEPQP